MKILILTLYPAIYRVELFGLFSRDNDVTVFFEQSNDGRNPLYLGHIDSLKYYVLDNEESYKVYKDQLNHIKEYDYVFLFEYHTKKSRDLMLKCISSKTKYCINCDGAVSFSHNLIKKIVKIFFIKKAYRLFAGCKKAKEYFLEYGAKEKQIVIHNFTSVFEKDVWIDRNNKAVKALREKYNLSCEKIAITAGRFIESKRFDLIIRSWVNMPHDYLLLIIGSGELLNYYNELIGELQLNNVKIISFLPKEVLFDYYKLSDVFLLTSSTDVWGLVINEALACGLPIISNNLCTAANELIVDNYNGFIVPHCKNEAAFIDSFQKQTLSLLSSNDDLIRQSANALRTSLNFTYEGMSSKILNSINEYEKKSN